MSDNPLLPLLDRHLPPPFDRVEDSQFPAAIDEGLKRARAAVDAIAASPEPPDFANTVEALEAADEGVDRIASVFFHLLHVDSNEALRALAREIPPKLSAFGNDVMMHPDLFRRLEQLDRDRDALTLTAEQDRVLDEHLGAFRRNGASLSAEDQQVLREIDAEVSRAAPAFSENVLNATQAFALWVADPEIVAPLPESARATAGEAAAADGRPDAWKFTLDAPSYVAFMTYAPDPALRREMWTAYGSRCVEGEFENQKLIRRILELKRRRARLLGYRDHVEYALERRMVGDRETVEAFYDRMLPVVMPAARRDVEAVRTCKQEETGDETLHPWDYAFYAEKLRQRSFDLRQEELRPWFEFESTLDTVFQLAGRLFDLTFEPVDSLPVNHPQVRTFRVANSADGSDVGWLLIDPFPRPSKRPGAWMNPLLGQGVWGGRVRRPIVSIVANFTPPTADAPSLLTMDEARTLFHEFGHALHELLSDCTYRSVAGTRVWWDFVELPSQLLENWLLEPEFLRHFPTHHQSGEPLPEALIEKIQASRTFQKGYQSARQLSFGLLDLAWYTTPPDQIGDDLIAFEQEALRELRLFEPRPGVAMSPSFQHIFAGGYAAGYYSYKWAEVLEADVFEAFRDQGLFDADTARRLREHILSKGGSRPPDELFRAFRGREPDPDALLRRDGLLEP